ncbi:hypothetical protein [Hymenobacter sp. YC55]|uniref:hypothetical protein n=1 Tax=Hymenobacter sp. YC55 TaxID=3034019 RepID=UPI0023F8165B|nr:hypothetical protein [Hymenobacter sp. YC55]MDF7811480.1 hypothetical protein [Hymenobacter sp. YC55]
MKYFFPLFLLSGALLTTACDKEDPEPTLLGRWNAESTTGYNYSATGQFIDQQTIEEKRFYLLVTIDSLRYRDIRDGSSWGSAVYTRQGNTIKYGNAEATITELTDHSLTLRFKNVNKVPNTPYQEVADHYVR